MSGERINADFSARVVLDTNAMPWVASPLPGVERRMLDRVGGEVARATSIVRYAAGSRFDAHEHALGEEFLVLDGVFSDEHGDYPAGTYVRNPPGSRHTPHSASGCTIFVKLRQFDLRDIVRVVIDTHAAVFDECPAPGVRALTLHRHGTEHVRLVRFGPGASIPAHTHPRGEEILVLEGGYSDAAGRYGRGAWVRNPPGSAHAVCSENGTLVYVKTGHLASE